MLRNSVLDDFVDGGLVERENGNRLLMVTAKRVEELPGILPGFAVAVHQA